MLSLQAQSRVFCKPVRISFRKFGNNLRSTIEVTAPSNVPNWESIPKDASLRERFKMCQQLIFILQITRITGI